MPFLHRPYLTLLLYALVSLGLYATINLLRDLTDLILHPDPFAPRHVRPWHSPQTGWYNRTTLLPSPSHIHLNASFLLLICQYSAWGDESFLMALFRPNLCLTETALLRMNGTDFDGMEGLVMRAMEVKKDFYNMAPHVFDISTRQLYLRRGGDESRVGVYQAYGFQRGGSMRGADRMAAVLWELLGLVGGEEVGDWLVDDSDGGKEVERLVGEVKEIQAGLWGKGER